MQKEIIAEIAVIAAREAITARDTIFAEAFDARFHDVKLLMKNYRRLKSHYDFTSKKALEVISINSLHYKTELIMSHVEKMLKVYCTLCQNSPEESRRWQILYHRYISENPMKIDEIVAQFNIDKRTFYRDVNRAMEDMAVLLFGIEALGTWKHGLTKK